MAADRKERARVDRNRFGERFLPMQSNVAESELKEIRVDRIDRNPENPRIVFRPGELETLMESIRRYGVQVPLSVFKEGRRYVLIDGERRWRCLVKLNRPVIPAPIQDKPTALTDLLLMFKYSGFT